MDMKKLKGAFRDYTKAPRSVSNWFVCRLYSCVWL